MYTSVTSVYYTVCNKSKDLEIRTHYPSCNTYWHITDLAYRMVVQYLSREQIGGKYLLYLWHHDCIYSNPQLFIVSTIMNVWTKGRYLLYLWQDNCVAFVL